MDTKSFASLALLASAAFVSSSACAQSTTDVEQVMIGVSLQTKRLDTALSNLGQIEKSLHGADAGSVDEVANAGRQFTGAVGEATPVGLILRHMKHPDDIRFTRAILAVSASKAVLVANTDAEIIDRDIPRIATPAAAAESAKIRDAILETRNLLETFAQISD
jgi:hypothetical protein